MLISKVRIFGWGLNFQCCARVAFVGVGYSFEQYYQAIRRCWRFGQKRPVNVHVVMAPTEQAIWSAVERKARDFTGMNAAMIAANRRACGRIAAVKVPYIATHKGELPSWL